MNYLHLEMVPPNLVFSEMHRRLCKLNVSNNMYSVHPQVYLCFVGVHAGFKANCPHHVVQASNNKSWKRKKMGGKFMNNEEIWKT